MSSHSPDPRDTEQALARYRLLSEHARDIMLFLSPEGRILEANQAAVKAYGYTREELLGLTVFHLRQPSEHALVARLLAQATARDATFEAVHRRRDGSAFPVEVSSHGAEIGGQRVLFSVIRDISERQRSEQALRESEERFRAIANAAPALIWISDAENRCTWFNQPWLAFTGRRLEQELGHGWMEGIHPDDLERYVRADLEAFERRAPVSQEFRLRRHDGEYRWILEQGQPVTGPDGSFSGYAGSCVDITDRRLAEEALRTREGELRLALAASRAGIWSLGADGTMSWSPEAIGLFGFEPAERPVTYAEWLSRVHPDDAPLLAQSLRDALEGRSPDHRAEYRIAHPELGVRWIMSTGRVEVTADGAPRRLSGIALDVSQHREIEARLHQAQRVQTVGRLAGGIAHEVNNLMTAVLGFGSFALRALEPRHPAASEVEQMVLAGERAAAITRQLLAFTRQQVLRPARLDPNRVVVELRPVLERLLGAEYQLAFALEPSLGEVHADRGQLEQVLVNLALNSRDAMAGGGVLSIETRAVELDAGDVARHPGIELARGRYVQLSVSDTGTGMDEATRLRVFEPFFTTKPVGQGTGLGLSTVYGIIKQSNGYVWIYSEPGLGTTVKVYLPLIEPAGQGETPESPGAAAPTGRGEVVLVAEDEPTVRALACRTLELHGYRVLAASDGGAAVALLEERGGRVDLVLSDAVMPGLSGRALGAVIARRWPAIPVIYMSGYPGKEVMDRDLVRPDAPFLPKPFTPDALARRVRDVLDRGPAPAS